MTNSPESTAPSADCAQQEAPEDFADSGSAAGLHAMAVLARTVMSDHPPEASVQPMEQQAIEEDADAWMDSRFCRTDSLSSRVVACLQPGGRLHAAASAARLEDLAELADSVLADKFAARRGRRKT